MIIIEKKKWDLSDLLKDSKSDAKVAWETLQEIKDFEEQHYCELSLGKIKLLAVYCIVSTVAAVTYLVLRLSAHPLLFLNVLFAFYVFFLWKRFYVYRVMFPDSTVISVCDAAEKSGYPKFLVRTDFKVFGNCKWFTKGVSYHTRTGILCCQEEPQIVEQTEESVVVSRLEKYRPEELQDDVDKLVSTLLKVSSDKLDSQFGRHLFLYYLLPLSELLEKRQGIAFKAADKETLLELLTLLTKALEGMLKVEEVAESDNFSLDLKAMLQMAKLDGLEG